MKISPVCMKCHLFSRKNKTLINIISSLSGNLLRVVMGKIILSFTKNDCVTFHRTLASFKN